MRRTQEGLASLSGVQNISFNPNDDTFTVRYHGDELDLASVNDAVRGKVVAKPLRKLLAWVGRPFRRPAHT